jgi:hypothetical protein
MMKTKRNDEFWSKRTTVADGFLLVSYFCLAGRECFSGSIGFGDIWGLKANSHGVANQENDGTDVLELDDIYDMWKSTSIDGGLWE